MQWFPIFLAAVILFNEAVRRSSAMKAKCQETNRPRQECTTAIDRSVGSNTDDDSSPSVFERPGEKGYPMDRLYSIDRIHYDVYVYTSRLLTRGMKEWMDRTRPVETMGRNLGYSDRTVNAINVAMTRLLEPHRKGLIDVRFLIDAFYYALDVANVEGPPGDGYVMKKVDKNFGTLFAKLYRQTTMDESRLVRGLTIKLGQFEDGVKKQFTVTVPLMKNAMLTRPAAEGTKLMNSLRKRIVVKPEGITLHKLALKYSKEKSGTAIAEHHSRIIRLIIPEMFGYVYDFLRLLYHLYPNSVGHVDLEKFMSFKSFAERLKTMFVERYFEFSGKTYDGTTIGELDELIEFCEPPSPGTVTVLARPTLHGFNTYGVDDGNDKYVYIQFLTVTKNKLLDGLVRTFGYDEDVRKSITNRIRFTNVRNNDGLIDMIVENVQEGLEIMDEFSSYFLSGDELVEKESEN